MAAKTTAHACDRVLSLAMQPWAIEREMLGVVASVLAHRLAGDPLDVSALEKREPVASGARGGVAIIPIHGVIAPRMNLLSDISGGATYEGLTHDLNEALAQDDIDTIVFDVDSPGGSALGATEFARAVREARGQKRIVAHANYMMASAAYWIGASCDELVAAPSAVVGSVGVYSIHEDLSAQLEQLGVKLTYVSAGKYKVEGNEAEPLSESARAHMQSRVDSFYGRFVADVAKGRGIAAAAVRGGYGEGRTLLADEALAAGMVDRIATFDETLAGVLPSHTPALAAANPPAPSATSRIAQARAAQRALMALGF